jgi:exosome complex RNA-binding protein Rrp42 (RNase PH superfamily)
MFLIGCVTTAEGSALVKLGNTTIMCGIKAVSRHYTCSEYGGGVRKNNDLMQVTDEFIT